MMSNAEIIGENYQCIRETEAEIEQMRVTLFLLSNLIDEGDTETRNDAEVKINELETAIGDRLYNIIMCRIVIAESKGAI